MAASTCFPSTLLCRVHSIQLCSHGRRNSYFPLHLESKVPSFVPLSSSPPRSSVIASLLPRNRKESRLAPKRKPPKKKTALDDFMEEEEQEYVEEEEESDEEGEDEEYPELDVLNAFFSQLEKDINNHKSLDDDDDEEIKEEDLVRFEKELTQALGEAGLESEEDGSDSEGIDEEDDLIQLPELKTWQMKKLARALKIGRRKASIKQLSEDVALDRATVLEYLRNPPPSLLLMSDSLPDECNPEPPTEPESSEIGSTISMDGAEVESKETEPVEAKKTEPGIKQVHPGQHPQKRLKRVQVETLERVYSRTKRPTDEMISSIVHVTNLPRKVVLKWFEDKREQDGIPQQPIFHPR